MIHSSLRKVLRLDRRRSGSRRISGRTTIVGQPLVLSTISRPDGGATLTVATRLGGVARWHSSVPAARDRDRQRRRGRLAAHPPDGSAVHTVDVCGGGRYGADAGTRCSAAGSSPTPFERPAHRLAGDPRQHRLLRSGFDRLAGCTALVRSTGDDRRAAAGADRSSTSSLLLVAAPQSTIRAARLRRICRDDRPEPLRAPLSGTRQGPRLSRAAAQLRGKLPPVREREIWPVSSTWRRSWYNRDRVAGLDGDGGLGDCSAGPCCPAIARACCSSAAPSSAWPTPRTSSCSRGSPPDRRRTQPGRGVHGPGRRDDRPRGRVGLDLARMRRSSASVARLATDMARLRRRAASSVDSAIAGRPRLCRRLSAADHGLLRRCHRYAGRGASSRPGVSQRRSCATVKRSPSSFTTPE